MTRVGTTSYMAPELFGNRQYRDTPGLRQKCLYRYNAMVDSWSFGITFVHCLTGVVPHEENLAYTKQLISDRALKGVVTALLQKNPLKRHFLHEIAAEKLKRPAKQSNSNSRKRKLSK